MKIIVYFSECEHDGDFDHYKTDVNLSGGTILASELNESEEVGILTVEVNNYDLWIEKFKETDSYGFSQYGI